MPLAEHSRNVQAATPSAATPLLGVAGTTSSLSGTPLAPLLVLSPRSGGGSATPALEEMEAVVLEECLQLYGDRAPLPSSPPPSPVTPGESPFAAAVVALGPPVRTALSQAEVQAAFARAAAAVDAAIDSGMEGGGNSPGIAAAAAEPASPGEFSPLSLESPLTTRGSPG